MIFGGAKAKTADADAYLADLAVRPGRGFAVVASGNAGYLAPLAQRVIDAFTATVERNAHETYRGAVAEAMLRGTARELNAAFSEDGENDEWSYGASFAAAWFMEEEVLIAHAGECLVLRWRQRSLQVLAEPDTLVAQLMGAGKLELANLHNFSHSHVLLNCLGLGDRFVCNLARHRLEAGDRFLLASAESRHRRNISEMLSSSSPDAIARELAEILCTPPSPEFGAAIVVAFAK